MEPVNNGSFPKRLQILNRSILHTHGAVFLYNQHIRHRAQARSRNRFKQTVVQVTDNAVCFQKDKSQL